MAMRHYEQSELWFSIILFALMFCVSTALTNVFFMRCDTNLLTFQKDYLGAKQPWILIFEHAMPLLAFNAFSFTAVLLGFLWARKNYESHAHTRVVCQYKHIYWTMIDNLLKGQPSGSPPSGASQPDEAAKLKAMLLSDLMKVAPTTSQEEGGQAIQMVGISGGEAIAHGLVAGKSSH